MKKIIEEIWPERVIMLNNNRAENIINSKNLDDSKKLELLEEVIDEIKEVLDFILSDN